MYNEIKDAEFAKAVDRVAVLVGDAQLRLDSHITQDHGGGPIREHH